MAKGRPGPDLGRGKLFRYPAPASRHFTPLYIGYVTKRLSIHFVSLSLGKRVFYLSSQLFRYPLFMGNVGFKEQNRLVLVEAKNSVLYVWAPIRADGASGATGYY